MRRSRLLWKLVGESLLVAAVICAGCSKNEVTSSEPAAPEGVAPADPGATPAEAPAPASAAPAQPSSPQPAPAQSADQVNLSPAALEGAVHPQMTLLLRKFVQQNGRMPKSFSEFGSSMMDSVPFPPAGMEFVIDETTREVKVRRLRK